MKNIVLLGSTGSIGVSTLKVAADLPDRMRVLALGAGNNSEILLQQTLKFRPEAICISDPQKAAELRNTLGTGTNVFSASEGLIQLTQCQVDHRCVMPRHVSLSCAPALSQRRLARVSND